MFPPAGGALCCDGTVFSIAVRALPFFEGTWGRGAINHIFSIYFSTCELRIRTESIGAGCAVDKSENLTSDGDEEEPAGFVLVVHAADSEGVEGNYINYNQDQGNCRG